MVTSIPLAMKSQIATIGRGINSGNSVIGIEYLL